MGCIYWNTEGRRCGSLVEMLAGRRVKRRYNCLLSLYNEPVRGNELLMAEGLLANYPLIRRSDPLSFNQRIGLMTEADSHKDFEKRCYCSLSSQSGGTKAIQLDTQISKAGDLTSLKLTPR